MKSPQYRAAYAEARAIAYDDSGYAETRLCALVDRHDSAGNDDGVAAALAWLEWLRGDSD